MPTKPPTRQSGTFPYASLLDPNYPIRTKASGFLERLHAAEYNWGVEKLFLSDEAVRRGLDPRLFQRWLERKCAPFKDTLHKAAVESVGRLREDREKMTLEQEKGVEAHLEAVIAAINRYTRHLESLKLPASFRGLMRRKPIDPQALLGEYEVVLDKAKDFLRRHRHFKAGEAQCATLVEMLAAFVEADPRDRHLLENRTPGQFAEAVVARRYGIASNTVHKHLIVARRSARRSRLNSRLHAK
jgi:hypothetical protein